MIQFHLFSCLSSQTLAVSNMFISPCLPPPIFYLFFRSQFRHHFIWKAFAQSGSYPAVFSYGFCAVSRHLLPHYTLIACSALVAQKPQGLVLFAVESSFARVGRAHVTWLVNKYLSIVKVGLICQCNSFFFLKFNIS